MLQSPFFPRFTEPTPVSAASCQYLQSQDADSIDNEISESGWTAYLEQSLNNWSIKNSREFDILKQQREESSITGNEDDSSMASDASSGPQKLPPPLSLRLPVQNPVGTAGSYSPVSTRKRDVHVNERKDLECVASCSSVDVNPRKRKFRKLTKNEHADLLLEDTASSSVRQSPEADLVESDVNTEDKLQLPAESLHDIEGIPSPLHRSPDRNQFPDALFVISQTAQIRRTCWERRTLQQIQPCLPSAISSQSLETLELYAKPRFDFGSVPCILAQPPLETLGIYAKPGIHFRSVPSISAQTP